MATAHPSRLSFPGVISFAESPRLHPQLGVLPLELLEERAFVHAESFGLAALDPVPSARQSSTFVIRRPPLGDFPRTAHDVIRDTELEHRATECGPGRCAGASRGSERRVWREPLPRSP